MGLPLRSLFHPIAFLDRRPQVMPSVLFVCTANRFRSPIAAAAFQKKLKDEGIQQSWRVGSAGTWTVPDLPVTSEAVQAARQHGFSVEGHTTCPVNAAVLAEYDLILVMEAGHKEAMDREFPAVRKRVHLLSEVVDGILYDVPDPVVSEESSPQEIADELCSLIEKGFRNICFQAERMHKKKNSA